MSASRRTTNTLSAIEKDDVNSKRRVHARFLSESNLRALESRLLEKVQVFINLLTDSSRSSSMPARASPTWCSAKNVSERCTWPTFDVITDLCYGQGLGMLTNADNRWFFRAIRAMSWRAMMCAFQPKIYQFKIDRLFLAASYSDITKAGSWVKERAMDRIDREYDSEKTDLFQSMMEAKDPKRGQEFGLKELWIESMLLLIAGVSQRNLSADNGVTPHILTAPGGSDSTSTAMAATFFYLAHHSSALDQVVTELKAAFAERDDIVSGTKLDSCKYLQACLNEAMRLVPSVPNVLPRYVLPGGIAVDGEYLPEGTIVGCCQYALNRHPDYFTEPNSFRPERWLCDERNTIGDVELARRAFSPFSTGP